MITIHIIEDDETLPTSIANGAGIATNRNAVGPLTVRISEEAAMGDRYEVHSVTEEDLSVGFPPGHVFRHGEVSAEAITLHGGGSIVAVRTTPGVWTGFISGCFELVS